ncbi:MAG: EAL domain-containing protein, partial [Nitratireductor sp.]|nr:EAL domain-containing protein [Nitratireductor sp.]
DEATVLADDLKDAVTNGQIIVEYQPIVSLEDTVIVGFEALVRWQHPKLGRVSPAEFVPIAESSGLINDIGYHVLNRAAQDFAEIAKRTGDDHLFVSVNISSREILRHDLINDIHTVLKDTGLPASMLRIEITESLVMENPEYSSQVLSRIKALGAGLSLDDFGTGYSSLSYLMRFPFDTIKIDQSFVQARDRKERLVVLRSIIAMAHGLNQKLIAEGIEYESDIVELMQLGCEYGQGYLLGEPMAFEEAAKLVSEELRLAGQ